MPNLKYYKLIGITGSGKPQTNAQNGAPSSDGKMTEGDTKPEFTREIQPVRFNEGMSARFECVVTGRPFPEIVWLRNGAPIAGYRYVCSSRMCKFQADLNIGTC